MKIFGGLKWRKTPKIDLKRVIFRFSAEFRGEVYAICAIALRGCERVFLREDKKMGEQKEGLISHVPQR